MCHQFQCTIYSVPDKGGRLIVGVTGGIGVGKSQLTSQLKILGAEVVDADQISHALADKPSIQNKLRERFGSTIFDQQGHLHRQKLRELVFHHPQKLQELNRIFHPPLIIAIKKYLKKFESTDQSPVVILDMAILYELNLQSVCDLVVVVDAPLEKRYLWISRSKNIDREAIRCIIDVQMKQDEKIRRAHILVKNEGSLVQLKKQAVELYTILTDMQMHRTTIKEQLCIV